MLGFTLPVSTVRGVQSSSELFFTTVCNMGLAVSRCLDWRKSTKNIPSCLSFRQGMPGRRLCLHDKSLMSSMEIFQAHASFQIVVGSGVRVVRESDLFNTPQTQSTACLCVLFGWRVKALAIRFGYMLGIIEEGRSQQRYPGAASPRAREAITTHAQHFH